MKRCNKCDTVKPRAEFNKDKRRSDGLYMWCQTCARAAALRYYRENREHALELQRAWRAKNRESKRAYDRLHGRRFDLMSRYGLSLDDYDKLFKSQQGLCAICSAPLAKANVDHDHVTGATRGLLCTPCNQGIGCFKDDPALLRAAIGYIEGQPKKTQ